MFEIEQTDEYERWFGKLRDTNAKARIDTRLRRVRRGNLGDARPVGAGVSELRIDYGPGYRIYFFRRNLQVIMLLAGGDKGTQAADIARAITLCEAIRSKT